MSSESKPRPAEPATDPYRDGRLEADWNSYWHGFMANPAIDALRLWLVVRAYRRLLDGLALPERPTFCEIGAGTGAVSRSLALHYGADVVVVDDNPIAKTEIQRTFKDFPNHFELIGKDALTLPPGIGPFDLVHSGGLIEHFVGEARQRIVDVHCEMTRPGGYVVILVPVVNAWYRLLNGFVFKHLHLLDSVEEVPSSLEEVTRLLAHRGFTVIRDTRVISELGVVARRVA